MRCGKLIEEMTWEEAEGVLDNEAIIVIPLGAASKEHGLHLQLRNDWLIAEYLKNYVLEERDVIIFPTINYSYYPAFSEYPGSVSLSAETSASMIFEVCQSIAKFGVKNFYLAATADGGLQACRDLTRIALHRPARCLNSTG
jgi:creatinine amidohydrolase